MIFYELSMEKIGIIFLNYRFIINLKFVTYNILYLSLFYNNLKNSYTESAYC
jgi:hypothetical protein